MQRAHGHPWPPSPRAVWEGRSVRAVGLKVWESWGHFRALHMHKWESSGEGGWRGNERFPAALVNAEQPISIWLVALGGAEHEVHLVRWENQPNNVYIFENPESTLLSNWWVCRCNRNMERWLKAGSPGFLFHQMSFALNGSICA